MELLPAGDRLPPGPPRPPAPPATASGYSGPPGGFGRRVRPIPFRRLTRREWLREAAAELRKTSWHAPVSAAYDAALVALAVVALVAFVVGIDAGIARVATSIF